MCLAKIVPHNHVFFKFFKFRNEKLYSIHEITLFAYPFVKDDTSILVSEGGKLHQLVDALNQVIIEDKRFIEVTKELHETANLSKSNMESFNESTQKLNEWVRTAASATED